MDFDANANSKGTLPELSPTTTFHIVTVATELFPILDKELDSGTSRQDSLVIRQCLLCSWIAIKILAHTATPWLAMQQVQISTPMR